jgi:hypothetical protein
MHTDGAHGPKSDYSSGQELSFSDGFAEQSRQALAPERHHGAVTHLHFEQVIQRPVTDDPNHGARFQAERLPAPQTG